MAGSGNQGLEVGFDRGDHVERNERKLRIECTFSKEKNAILSPWTPSVCRCSNNNINDVI